MNSSIYFTANNEGQMAFQLFYERLLIIDARHKSGHPTYLRENAFHLATIINTFNRHHCHEVKLTPSHSITPVFLNFELSGRYSLHRLLAIDLHCHNKNTADDTFVLVFDDPLAQVARADKPKNEWPVIVMTLGTFKNEHYKRPIYSFESHNYDELGLLFDIETSNFYYNNDKKNSKNIRLFELKWAPQDRDAHTC